MFSNFSRHSITVDGSFFKTVEHYFQAMKFYSTDQEWFNEVRTAPNPAAAKKMGHDRQHKHDPNWDTVRIRVMWDGLVLKAIQHPDFRKALLDTGDSMLVEQAYGDYFWGEGRDGSGLNVLGRLLVKLRTYIRTLNEINS